MGLGLRIAITAAALLTISHTERPRPSPYLTAASGTLAESPITVAKLCDTTETIRLIRENSAFANAFEETVPSPSAKPEPSPAAPAVFPQFTRPFVSPQDRERITRAYARNNPQVTALARRLGVAVPQYSVMIDYDSIFALALERTHHSSTRKTDSTVALINVNDGRPIASTRAGKIFINPLYIDEAIASAIHEQVHVFQSQQGSSLVVPPGPRRLFIMEGVAAYLNERSRYGLMVNPTIDAKLVTSFSREAAARITQGRGIDGALAYGIAPALIAHYAMTIGPIPAARYASILLSCGADKDPILSRTNASTGLTGQSR